MTPNPIPPEAPLERHPFLAGLDAASHDFLAGCASWVTFAPGTFLLREGEAADRLYLIQSGRVALEIQAGVRGPVLLETVTDGDILGLSWLLAPARWQLDARAVDPVGAHAFDATCLRRKMDENHDIGYALSQRLLVETILRLERVRLQRLDIYKAEAAR